MINTVTQKSKIYQIIHKSYKISSLKDDSESYCENVNKDLRIYLLGLTLAENQKDSYDYLNRFFNSIDNRKSFTDIWSKFTIEMLGNKDFGVINYCEGHTKVQKSIQDIISLLEQYGDNIPRSAAWSAESAARSAAWSARSAAWSAESAARSAAWSAESAARSAESAARSAARSAAWKKMGDRFLEILEEE